MDRLSPAHRSENMRRIRSRDTSPELEVRRVLHRSGLRYRLHGPDLPGRPDLVFSGIRCCLFVHGCFWHGCRRCVDGTRRVKSKTKYWRQKIAGNSNRDARHIQELKQLGWRVFVIWECDLRGQSQLNSLVRRLLSLRARQAMKANAQGSSGGLT